MKSSFPLFVSLLFLASAQAEDRPNLLFIYTDDHSHRTISAYPEAYNWVDTPNIDALAEHGVRFAHATIGTWCMPSRATVLTGLHQTGVQTMRMEGDYPGSTYDPKQCRFWPSVLRENGYQTAHIGKWHTGTDTGYGRDWDHQIVWNRPAHQANANHYYYDQLIEKNGAEAVMTPGYSTDNYTDWAVDFLTGRDGKVDGKPWFLWVCYGGVHGPFTPATRHLNDYPDAIVDPPADIYPPRAGKPDYSSTREQWAPGSTGAPILRKGQEKGGIQGGEGKTLTDWVRQVNQAVRSLDEGVGKLVATLKETGQYDNTLIVFTSDQGFAWGQHGFQVKLAPYDANIRSPFIVSMPAELPSDEVRVQPVNGTDLAPTLLAAAGVELPWPMHGQNLIPLLKNSTSRLDRSGSLMLYTGAQYGAETEFPPSHEDTRGFTQFETHGIPWWVSFTDERYKYIRNLLPGEVEELYDLQSDPEELINLAVDSAAHAPIVESMRSEAVTELKRIRAPYVPNLPPVASLPQP